MVDNHRRERNQQKLDFLRQQLYLEIVESLTWNFNAFRPYQKEVFDKICDLLDKGKKDIFLAEPTGSCKAALSTVLSLFQSKTFKRVALICYYEQINKNNYSYISK